MCRGKGWEYKRLETAAAPAFMASHGAVWVMLIPLLDERIAITLIEGKWHWLDLLQNSERGALL
jgi:hypothetical protein